MTGPEQHAATVERLAETLQAWRPDSSNPTIDRAEFDAALDELVALASEAERLAGRADELERENAENDRKAREYRDRWEGAKASLDRLQGRVYAMENMLPDGYLATLEDAEARADELQRERDDMLNRQLTDAVLVAGMKAQVEQARREADQLRALVAKREFSKGVYLCRYCWESDGHAKDCEAAAALAGLTSSDGQAEPCTNCDGLGHNTAWPHTTCPVCKGAGVQAEERTFTACGCPPQKHVHGCAAAGVQADSSRVFLDLNEHEAEIIEACVGAAMADTPKNSGDYRLMTSVLAKVQADSKDSARGEA